VTGVVEVGCRRGVIWVCSYSQTIDGLWVMNEELESFDDEVDDVVLGVAVLKAGRASRHGVPTPSVAELSRPAPVVVAAGVKSYAQYLKGLRSVSVEVDAESVRVVPQRNGGPKHGLVPIPDVAVGLDSTEPGVVGAGVRAGLNEAG
jgi:hypothetical protein